MPLTGEAKAAYQRAYHARQKALRAAFRAGYEGARKAEIRETGSPEAGVRPETRETEGRRADDAGIVSLGSPRGCGVAGTEPVERVEGGVEESLHVEETRQDNGRGRRGSGWRKMGVPVEPPHARLSAPAALVVGEALSGQHGNLAAAARAAGVIGPTDQVPTSLRERVNLGIREVLERCGAHPDYVARKMMELSSARQTKFFAHEGKVQDSREVNDNEIQFKATDKLAAMNGMYPRDADGAAGPGSISITLEQVAPADGQPAQAQRAVITIGE